MTTKDLNINTVMDRLIKKELTITEASTLIQKSTRQTKRIKKRYKQEGSTGIIHKLRGQASNNKIDPSKYFKLLQIIKTNYYDYGPTLSSEKLLEKHNIIIPVSTLRLKMIQEGIWKGKTRKKVKKQFTARPRKSSYGEMIQYDGSYHLWFEGRNGTEYQCLLVAVDDATGEVIAKFAKNEGLFSTFQFWEEYFLDKGKPQSIYLDKFATYKVNYPNATDDRELPTQFNRACQSLGIKLIFAETPQAKGRVERMNGTLQDRLVKALREEGVSDMETANIFLKEIFLPDFNKKFMVEAKSESNLHLNLRKDEIEKLPQYLSKHLTRVVANDFTIRFKNVFYQLFRKKNCGYTLRPKQKITVEEHIGGEIKLSKNGVYVENTPSFERPERQFKLLTAPISETNLDELKEDLLLQEQQILKKKRKQVGENKDNRDTYYEKNTKVHPYIATIFNKKKIETFH